MITYYSQPLIDEQSRPADEYFPLTHLGDLVEIRNAMALSTWIRSYAQFNKDVIQTCT